MFSISSKGSFIVWLATISCNASTTSIVHLLSVLPSGETKSEYLIPIDSESANGLDIPNISLTFSHFSILCPINSKAFSLFSLNLLLLPVNSLVTTLSGISFPSFEEAYCSLISCKVVSNVA